MWVGLLILAGGAKEIEERFGLSELAEDCKERTRNKGHEPLEQLVALFFTRLLGEVHTECSVTDACCTKS